MKSEQASGISRRGLLSVIGIAAGSGTMYQAMTQLGLAAESGYKGRIALEGDPKGASVLVLGAGLAGMTAAFELRRAGYKVELLEFNNRPGGRNWSLRGGDNIAEIDGATQTCGFAKGQYFNPGPCRIPSNHHAVLDYCKRFGVALEPFIQLDHNAFLHSATAFSGKPQRIRAVKTDLQGHIAELLAKTTAEGKLDQPLSPEDQEILLDALRSWGALDKHYRYRAGDTSAPFRGYRKDPGGGLEGAPEPGEPLGLADLLRSGLWFALQNFTAYYFQSTMLQPVGGMDMIGKAFAKQLGDIIRYDAKVTRIQQNERHVTVTYDDARTGGGPRSASADWCVCTLPPAILSRIPIDVGRPMKEAIAAVPFASSVKVGLQFKRRFWEEDEAIYGGISFTDLPVAQIGYPSAGLNGSGKGMLLGAYVWDGPRAAEFTAMAPAERVRRAVELGAQIHPQYPSEFETGISVAWQRIPFARGCASAWTEEAHRAHYNDLCEIDGRIVLAGEHASYLPAWQEGAILSALDAISRLHRRVVAT